MTKKKKSSPTETKEVEEKGTKKPIVIKETEEDLVFDHGLAEEGNFKEAVKSEIEKGKLSKIVIPIVVLILLGIIVAGATWYYAKPEKTVPSTDEKIMTPPEVKEEAPKKEETKAPAEKSEVAKEDTTTSTSSVTSYTVKEGDTLSGIADKFDMTSSALAKYNGLKDADALHIGQVLKIPAN